MRMLDLFAGELGWGAVFAARGWEVTAIDIKLPRREIPRGVEFHICDVLKIPIGRALEKRFHLICASSVCDGFASYGMPHFRKNPPYPIKEIEMFEHTRRICEAAGVPHVLENVRSAQQFVGPAVAHCGAFYLWGTGVPPILPQGISKTKWYRRPGKPGNFADELNWSKAERKAKLATIPPELANCVAEYAERLLETKSAESLGQEGLKGVSS